MRNNSLSLRWKQRLDEVSAHLGKRNLIWLGFRGADASALLQIPQFSRVFSITAPLEDTPNIPETCLEILQKKRNDVHTFNPDEDNSEEAVALHKLLFTELNKYTAVLTYKADKFFSAAYYAQSENVEYFGSFYNRQAAFENKPWVESELKKAGVRTIPWSYYLLYNLPDLTVLTSRGPVVVRSDKPSIGGGGNMVIIREPTELIGTLDSNHDSLISVSPYFEPNVPLNVNACVFQDGSVSLHGPSLQLIGIRSCTNHVLGYCGNDFDRIRNLDVGILDELEDLIVKVGKWLASMGYLGVFGVDAIEYQGHIYFSEINPRFQNSSVITAQLDQELDRPDMYLNHMAAFIGLPGPPHIPLRELVKRQRGISQIICNNRHRRPVLSKDLIKPECDNMKFTLFPAGNVEVIPEGMLFRALVKNSVTENGHSLFKPYEHEIASAAQLFSPKTTG
jgi:hypothetical protein